MSNMVPLTEKQREVLEFIERELTAGKICPTHREIAAHFKFKSSYAAGFHVRALLKKGVLLADDGKARSLRLASNSISRAPRGRIFDIPLFGSIPAGLGGDREQAADGCVSVNIETIGFKPSRNTFALRVVGDS